MQRVFLIITACLALLVAGCGSDSNSTEDARERASALAEKFEQEEKAEARKAAKAEVEAEAEQEVAEEEAAALPKPDVPAGPPEKLVTKDVKEGSGAPAKAGDEVSVHYVGVLYKEVANWFDASWDNGEPITFKLGAGEVISGWDQGIEGMKVGGRRELIIPPSLAYGSQGSGPIAPNSTLVFVVDLLGVE